MSLLNLFDGDDASQVLSKLNGAFISVSKWKENDDFLYCLVKRENNSTNYILAKTFNDGDISWSSDAVLEPAFVVKTKFGERYAGFLENDLKQFHVIQKNNVVHMKSLINSLAKHQASVITRAQPKTEFNLDNVVDSLQALPSFKDLDKALIRNQINNLQKDLNNILDKDILVSSLSAPGIKSAIISKENKEVCFLKVSSGHPRPIVYDVLSFIFTLSNEAFRQEHFEELIWYYFHSFRGYLQENSGEFTRTIFENQVKILLPVVKLELLKDPEILTNIKQFLLYPQLNQEDIYQVLKNKIQSSDYKLVSYDLKPLTIRNGHLGQYYHLNIVIKQGTMETKLKLFAKFLIATVKTMQETLEQGPAVKEDFFYSTLLPLYSEYGLDSIIDFAPKCYLSRLPWVLILDDLEMDGYRSLTPNTLLDYEGLRTVLKQLAKFHASSIILEEIMSIKQEKKVTITELYSDIFSEKFVKLTTLRKLLASSGLGLQYLLKLNPEVLNNATLSLEEIVEGFQNIQNDLQIELKPSNQFRNVICHGDMYIGNVLLKFNPNKSIDEVILIDFQVLRYIPSGFELLFFLYLTASKETRDIHLDELVSYFYDLVAGHLKQYNVDPDKVYPKDKYDLNLKQAKGPALIRALAYAHLMHLDPKFREDIFHDDKKFNYFMFENRKALIDEGWASQHYRTVIKGLVQDLVNIICENK